MTCKCLPTNNGLLMHNVLQLCLAANDILRKWSHAFLLLATPLACKALTEKVLVFWIRGRTWEEVAYERWSHTEVRLYTVYNLPE